jgi:PTS system nitrogen regulatory IIA component
MELTVRETARLLNVSPETVYRWIKSKGLPAHQVNEQYRCNRAELLEWATASGTPISPKLFREPVVVRAGETAAAGAPPPSLAQAIEAGGILYDLPGRDARSVLAALVEHIALPKDLDRAFLLRMLLAREALGSTGIGDGIAIPHVRNPIVLRVRAPMVSLAFLGQPAEFGALDGKPVSILFSLISPTIRIHLRLLSKIAFALRDPELRQALRQRAARSEILAHFTRIDASLAASPMGVATRESRS